MSRPAALRRAVAAGALLAVLAAADALWLEPRGLLLEDRVALRLPGPRLRILHLADLHVARETGELRRLLARAADARPDLVAISGDLIDDVPDAAATARHIAAAAAFVGELRRTAPVVAVQGHSDYLGSESVALERAGLEWLRNQGRRIGPAGAYRLLGVDQQVGQDAFVPPRRSPFRPLRAEGRWTYGAAGGESGKNFYSHWDPAPRSLADAGGPLAWSGYDALCDVRLAGAESGAGLIVHSRYPLGEDRMIRLRRVSSEGKESGSFYLVAHGTVLEGDLDTGVVPKPGRWYRLRVRTVVLPDRLRVLARVWPAEEREPAAWQAAAQDRSPGRPAAGTVGLWAWGAGEVAYRNLRVVDPAGRRLLDAPLAGPGRPPGFRDGARGTRLAMALARSPRVPPGTPTIVLSHVPDVVLEAAWRGLDAVLAGHTHGGQVRLPLVGALLTRSHLGPYYDLGTFPFAAPTPRGWTTLYLNPGVGTSFLPIRFWDPPRYAVVEVGGKEGRTAPVRRF